MKWKKNRPQYACSLQSLLAVIEFQLILLQATAS